MKHTSLIHKRWLAESLFNAALVQLLYYLLSLCSYSRLSLALNLSSCFFKRQFYCIKTCHTMQLWKVYLNVFSLVTSPRIEQQQLSIKKFSLNLTRYQKIVASILLYKKKKKIRTRVERWLCERYYSRKFKNLFFKYKSEYLCWGLQNKIIKNPVFRATKFHAVEACKTMFHWTTLWKVLFFISQVCCGETGKVSGVLFMLSSV